MYPVDFFLKMCGYNEKLRSVQRVTYNIAYRIACQLISEASSKAGNKSEYCSPTDNKKSLIINNISRDM